MQSTSDPHRSLAGGSSADLPAPVQLHPPADDLSPEALEELGRERRTSYGVLRRILPHVAGGADRPERVVHHWRHTNDLLEAFIGARRLMLKRAAHGWAEPRFRAARRAARLLRERGDVVVPEHLELPPRVDGHPVIAYWRVPLPTLREAWPRLGEARRRRALRSWGVLLRRVHEIRLDATGRLGGPREERGGTGEFLRSDLGDRLLPAARAAWPEGVEAIRALEERGAEAAERAGEQVLLHADLHWSNVLYDPEEERCVGLIDLEAAMGGPREVDLAYLEVVHSPLMAGPPRDGWLADVREGYGRPGLEWLLAYFRAWHLLNMGYYAVDNGWRERGRQVLEAVDSELARL